MKILNLSYELSESTPGFNGEKNFAIEEARSMNCGHSSNSLFLKFHNHMGTHIDLPLHFHATGKSLSDYELKDFLFDHPHWVDFPTAPDELISADRLKALKIPTETDLLLFRTGCSKFRHEERYYKHNPGFSPECADHLRKTLPHCRAIGFDFISLTALAHRDAGREAHRNFLAKDPALWIIEDMNLEPLAGPLTQVMVSPLLVKNADGGPVTVWGFTRE